MGSVIDDRRLKDQFLKSTQLGLVHMALKTISPKMLFVMLGWENVILILQQHFKNEIFKI